MAARGHIFINLAVVNLIDVGICIFTIWVVNDYTHNIACILSFSIQMSISIIKVVITIFFLSSMQYVLKTIPFGIWKSN